ncbi:MAG: DUF4397 domain-containing protein [Aggregatilineales bacterium]
MRSRSILLGTCALALLALLTRPAGAQTTGNDNVGFIRFAHTAVDVPPIDVYVGNNSQPVVTNLKYGDVTDFMALSTTLSDFVARAAGSAADSQPLFSLQWGIKANESELITAAGLNSRKAFLLEPLVLVRNDTKGKARVRILDTVWGGSFLSVGTTQGTTFSSNQKYLNASNDTDVDLGTYDFEVKDNTGKVVATASGVNLEADKVYVMLITGSMDGSTPIKLTPVVSDEDKTRVQIVNQSGNPIDVYVKGQTQPFVSGLNDGASSDFTTLPSGAVTFVVRNAGSSATDKEVASLAIQLRPERDTVITVSASGGAVQIAITSDTLTVTPVVTPEGTLMATVPGTLQATMPTTQSTHVPPTTTQVAVTGTVQATMPGTIPATQTTTPTGQVTKSTATVPVTVATGTK